MAEMELIKKRIEAWKEFRKGEEKKAEERHNDSLYKQWGIERVNLDENPQANEWSEKEIAEFGLRTIYNPPSNEWSEEEMARLGHA